VPPCRCGGSRGDGVSILLVEALGRAEPADLGHILLLNYLWPIWIVLLGLAMLGTGARRRWRSGRAGRIRGLVVGAGHRLRRTGDKLAAARAGAGGRILWALYSVLLRRWHIPAERAARVHFAVCACAGREHRGRAGPGNPWPAMDVRAALWSSSAVSGLWGWAITGGDWHQARMCPVDRRCCLFIPHRLGVLIGLFFRKR